MIMKEIEIFDIDGNVLFEHECVGNTLRKTVEKAVSEDISLHGAFLRGSDLRGSDLSGSDLRDADLSGSDLRGANLCDAYLDGAFLRGAILDGALFAPGWKIVRDDGGRK